MKSLIEDVYEGDHYRSGRIYYPEEVRDDTVGGMIFEYFIPHSECKLTKDEARKYLAT